MSVHILRWQYHSISMNGAVTEVEQRLQHWEGGGSQVGRHYLQWLQSATKKCQNMGALHWKTRRWHVVTSWSWFSWIGKCVKPFFKILPTWRAGSKRAVRNGGAQVSAHVRAQGLKSERTKCAGERANAQVGCGSERASTRAECADQRVAAHFHFFVFTVIHTICQIFMALLSTMPTDKAIY